MTRCSTSPPGPSSSNGPRYVSPTSSSPRTRRTKRSSGYRATATHSPLSRRPYSASGLTAAATFAGSVQGVVVQITTRLAGPVEQREAHVERRVASLLVDARLRQLVLRERGAAARAPLGRAVPEVEPPALVDDLQEAPDVLDVRVAEREVVVPPVHPLAEPDRALGQRARGLDDHLATPPGELGEPVLLDLALRVEPEPALDADLDPEPLAVEPVLVALVVAAERLVALEDVLQRPAPGGVDAEHVPVGRHRAVDEAEPRAVGVLLAQPPEGLLALPELEHVALERVVIRLVRQRCEHAVDSRMRSRRCLRRSTGRVFRRPSFPSVRNLTRQPKRKDQWH